MLFRSIGHHKLRPKIVVGFAAETQNIAAYGQDKLARKNADVIVANDVSAETGTFGGDENTVTIVSRQGNNAWPALTKTEVAERLAALIAERLNQ